MPCCRRLPPGSILPPAALLPRATILPLRFLVALTLLASVGYILLHFGRLNALMYFLFFLQFVASWSLISECRRSQAYYQAEEKRLQQNDRNPPSASKSPRKMHP